MRTIAKAFLVVALPGLLSSSVALAADHTVTMNGDYFGNMYFEPAALAIHQGDRVRWTNVTAIIHTATGGSECFPDGSFSVGNVSPGATTAYVTFNTISSFAYYCRFHCEMGMVGEIEVQQIPVKTALTTWGRVKALYTVR
jgi:plastocyanin